jgi:hypothetical protein
MCVRLGRPRLPAFLDGLRRDPHRFWRVALDVPSALPLIVFKLPLHRTKGITYGDIRVFMGMSFTMFTLRDHLGSRGSNLNVDFIDTSLTAVFVRKLDDHPAVNYLRAEFLEALRQLPYAGFKSGRRLDTSPSDLSWQRHFFGSRREQLNAAIRNYSALKHPRQYGLPTILMKRTNGLAPLAHSCRRWLADAF